MLGAVGDHDLLRNRVAPAEADPLRPSLAMPPQTGVGKIAAELGQHSPVAAKAQQRLAQERRLFPWDVHVA